MLGDSRVVAIVPARAGSKGLPGKNTKPLLGRPLAAWSIDAARDSRYVDDIVVTSDDEAVLTMARELDIARVLRRPPELATDASRMCDVILDAIERLEPAMDEDDVIVLLQPTSPLRHARHIDEALDRLVGLDGRAVVGVCRAEHSPLVMNVLPPDGLMGDFLNPVTIGVNRQELPDFYRINGAMYAARVSYFRELGGFIGTSTVAFIMEQDDSVDIDSDFDFRTAECEMRRRMKGQDER
ncbi:MAG: acylneuraminate cytidylyltransferase family protein [Coriobacteriia bacterium]